MPIYTKTGDKGKTSLFSGQRVSKADLRIEACGTVDELNSTLGAVLSIKYLVLSIERELTKIQNDLLDIGSALANPAASNKKQVTSNFSKRVKEFEDFIDEMTAKIPKLSNFILPGGGKTGAMLHFARTVCRRAERRIVELNNKQPVDKIILIYFNRLSDLLFTMARFANFRDRKQATSNKRQATSKKKEISNKQ